MENDIDIPQSIKNFNFNQVEKDISTLEENKNSPEFLSMWLI